MQAISANMIQLPKTKRMRGQGDIHAHGVDIGSVLKKGIDCTGTSIHCRRMQRRPLITERDALSQKSGA